MKFSRSIIFVTLLLLISCKTQMPGKVSLENSDQKIPLINSAGDSIYLDHGENTVTASLKKIEFYVEGVKEEIRLPLGVIWKKNFYYHADQIKQPVDVKGTTHERKGKTFERIETRSCRNSPYCYPGDYCNGHYQVVATYQEVFEKFQLDFYHPQGQLNQRLGDFIEKDERMYEELVDERPLSYCY